MEYRGFIISKTEYGGVYYTPEWMDGSEVAPTASNVEEAKVEIDAYWTDELEITAMVTTGNWLHYNITKFTNVSKAEKFLAQFGGFIRYYQNGHPYYNAP